METYFTLSGRLLASVKTDKDYAYIELLTSNGSRINKTVTIDEFDSLDKWIDDNYGIL